jgi:hypothetical protein
MIQRWQPLQLQRLPALNGDDPRKMDPLAPGTASPCQAILPMDPVRGAFPVVVHPLPYAFPPVAGEGWHWHCAPVEDG